MAEPKLTPRYANRLKPEPPATNQTEQAWRTMQSRGYWESPMRVARYYNVIRTAPPGWKAPEWLDVDAVNTAYAYMRERNGNKPYTEWSYLPYNDPGSAYLRSLSAPPENMLWPNEVGDIKNRNRWPMELRSLLPDKNPPAILPGAEDAGPMTPEQIAEQQPYGDWNDLKLWQQVALGALSPQAPLEDRPEWTRWTAAGFQGALAGLGGAYLGSVAGPIGALAGFLSVGGLAAWQAFSGEKIPVVGDALMLLDQPALFLEKTIGVGEQLSAEGWKKVISELPEAYQAGAFSYESGAFSTRVLNALAVIGGDQPAAPGEVWMLEQGLTEPQKAGEAVGPEALARYRRMLLEGASMDDLYADAQENYGFSGTAADFLFQSVLDPLNLAPYAGGKLGAKVAEAAGNKRLANAFEMGVGNPLIDILPPGIQGLTSKITGIQGSQGPLQSFNTYKDWVRQGTFQAGVERVLPGDLSAYEKRVAGLTAEGKIKEVQPRAVMPGKKSLGTLFNYLTTLDDASRAHVFLNILHNNLNAMLTLSEGKPADMVTTLKKITGKAQFAKDDPVMELMASPAMATIQNALRAAVDSGVADEMLASWEATAQNRIILAKISQALNMQPGKVLELLQSKPDHLTALLNEKAPMVGRPEDLKQLLGAFVGDDALPWNANKFQAQLVIELANKTDQWVINAYGLKPDSAVVRLSQLLKSAQSFLLLSFNPGYFVNNELNNMVTRAAEGVWGYMTPKEIGTFMDRFGLTPARMDVGIGAAETGAFEGGLQAIGKAKQSKDALAVAQRIIGNTTDKVGLFSKLSSEFEKRESRQTTVISMKRFWKKYWKRGRGLRRMPPAIESLLDARYPGMKEVVYAAAEAGMSMDEIQNGLYSGVVRPAVSEVIDTISRQISPDNPERITDLMAHLGIDQKLEESLANSTTPDQVDVAFNEIEKQMQGWVDEKVAAGLQTRAEDVRNKIKAERIPALLRIFGDMEIEWGKRWVDGRLEWEDLYARKDQGEFQDAAAWQQAVEALNAKQDADWHNIQKWVTQTYKGIIEALGLEDPRGQKFLKEIDTIFEDWHKFYEIRKKKFADYRRSTAKKSGETWEQVNQRKSIAWAKLQDELMDLYDQHTKKERTAQRNMDNLFATMFAKYTGWDTTAAKRWREQIDEMRATLVAMQTEFRKQVRDMLPEDRDAAYLEFNKEYNALVAKMKQLEQQGAFEVARQTTPPAQPQGEPGPQPSPEPTAPTQLTLPTQPTQPADIRDGLTPEQRQQYDDLLANGVPADLISVDEQGNVTAPEPVASRAGPLLIEAEKYGIPTRTKAGDPMERVALNVINKYSGQKFNNLGDVPPDVATAAYKKHQEAHLGEQAKASAKLVIDAQEIIDMADAQAREARVKQMGALTRRAVRESLLSVLGDDELAAEATLTLMDSHADVWAKNKGWAPGEAARDAWYATHIAKILRGDESAPGSTMNGLEQLPALEGARIRLQRATEAYDAYAKSNDLIEGRSFLSWETWYRTIKGLDRSIPMDVWNVIYELDNAKFDLDMLSWLNANNKEWSGRSMFEYLDYQRNVQYSNVRYQEVNGQHRVSWDANGSPMQPRLFDNAESAHRFAEGLENGQYLYQQSLEYQAIRVAWERPEPTPIDTPEFRAFFGNSHVIDVDGVPREVYHGTSHGEFDTLSENLVGKNYHAGYRGTGYYFSSSLGTGEYYTGVGGGGQPTLYKTYLSIQRPYYWEAGSVYDHYYGDLPLPNDIRAEVERVSGIKFGSGQSANPENARSDMRILADAIQSVIKAKGHDGIIYNTGKVTEYVVFDRGQAKNIYNRGTWDRSNPNMLMQAQPLFQRAKGSYELLPDGRAIIRAFNAADVSTIVHEIGHVFRRDLGDADMDAMAKLGGLSGAAELRLLESRFTSGTLKQGDANFSRYVAAEEAFARGWEAYLAEGRAPTPQLRSVFRRFTNWLLGIYKNLKRFMGRTTGFEQQPELAKVNLNAEINGISLRDIFDRLLADERKQPADFYDLVYKRADALQKEGRNYRFTKDQLNIRARREIIGELFADFKSLDEAIAKADELDADPDGGVILSGDGTPIDSATLWEAIQTVKAYPEIAPWAEVAQVRGTKTVARGIADPNNQYEFQFKVMDLNDLQASDLWEGEKIVPNPNYPQELQPRIRGKKQSVANTDDRARNLVPAELLFDAQALDRGAPIVGPDNFVESGNGRVLSLMRAASTYPEMYDSYRQALLAILPQYGIDPASIEGMERPVLVRERLTEVDRAAFASDANKPIAEKMDPAEVALNDARLISDQSLINLEVGDNETIEAALQSSRNNAFVQSWLKQLSTNELAELSKNGQINSVGIQRLIHALFAKVYKGVEGERLLNAFTMSMDSGVKNAQSAIMASLPQMARMEGMIAAGVRSAGLSLAGDVAVAVDKMASIRASGKMTVTEYLSSAPMFGEEMTPVQRGLLEFFAQQKQPKRIREMLREYALQVIDHEPDPNQMGLFGDVAGRTKEDLLNAAIRQLEPETPEGSLFAAQPEPTAAVEPAPVAVEPEPGAETTPATTDNTEKAPWQMTADEFTARFESSIDPNKHDFGGLTKKQYVQMMSRAGRHNAVYQALVDGKAVPPEVLADFPGLPEEAAKAKGSWAAVQKPTAARVQTRAEQIRLVMKDITEGRPSFKVALEYGLSGDKNYPLRQELAKIVFGVEDYNDPISVNTLVHEMFRAAGLDTMYLTEDRAWKAFEKWVNGKEIIQETAQVKTVQPAEPPVQRARRVRNEQIVQDFEAGKPVKLDELQDADDSGMLNLDDIIRGIQEQEGGNEGQEGNARPGGSLLQEEVPGRSTLLGERRPGGAVRPADTRRPSDTVARNLHEEQGQVTDLSHILTAFDAGHRGYVLANGTGTGKTYVALGLLAEIRPRRALIVVPNANIGTQWADASGKFGVAISKLDQSDAGDGIFTTTYTDLTARYKRKELSALIGKKWDLVIFDESHKLKNYDGSDSTQQAYVGVQIAKVADRSLYMSATPYQGLTEMRYLESLGLWQEGEYESFLAEHGYEYMQLPTGDGYWRFAGDPAQLVDVQKRMIEMGVFSQRDLLLQGVKLDNNFLRVNLNGYEESYRRANMIFDRYKEYAYTPRQRALIESQRTLVLRRIMELSKTKEAIRAAQEHLASGRQVAIFVGFRSDLRAPELKKFPGLTRDVDALYASLGEDGNIKQIVDALGGPSKVAQVHGGAGGDAAIDADIKAYQRGYKRVLVATAAKGGTGLSLHDTMGNAPRTQINVYLPWNGQEYQQVSGRSYRTGSKSDVIQVWLFSDAGKEATIAATVGGRLKEMGAVVRGIEADADAGRIAAFEMDMLDDPHIEAAFAKKLRVPGDGIYAVRTEPFEYGGQTIVSRVYVNGQHVAYLPEGMKTAQTFETRAGKARVLGLDVKNPSQWVYVIIDTGQLGKFDPKRPALQQAGPSLFQEDANPMGDVPLGSVPEPMNEGMAADEVHSELLRPAMRKMRQEFKRKMGERPLEVGGADDETQKLIRAYLKQVNVDMASAKLATMNYGMQMRDAALLNYSRRFGADTILQMIFPYEFWYTRTFMNWARRMIDKPTWWATYARYRQAQEKMERDGMPQRLQGKVRIPMPFLDDWMGGGLWIDPLRQAFPPDSFFQPVEQFMNDQAQVQRAAEATLGEMLRNGEITQADFNAAVETRSGTYWELARKQAEFENNKDSSAAGLVSTMMQPALWWTIPSALIKGKPETINPLPITRTASSIETALAGTPLETVGKAVGLAAWPERTIRKAAGLSEFGQWGDYYVERQIANMAADGTVTPEQANIAMVEKGQNPVYQQAFQRVQQEMMLRTQGAQALSKLARGDLKGAWGSLPQLFFSGGLFPEGELKLRGLKPEYDNAWRKYNAGDTEAINQFFEDHPEYETRLALYDEPSERLRQFLISEVWDRYSALSKANKTKAVNALGQDFVDTFLDKNTRSYDAITVDTLARWSWTLGGAVPKTGETETLAQPEPMEIYPPEVSAAVDAYHAERDSRFQDVLPLQEIYYALPKAQRTAYLNSVPRLRKYWEWNRQYKADHPDLAPYLQDQQEQMDQETMSEFNDSLLRQLVAHYLGGQPLSSGARADLRRIWQKSGEPGASFEDWVEGAVRSTFVGQ